MDQDKEAHQAKVLSAVRQIPPEALEILLQEEEDRKRRLLNSSDPFSDDTKALVIALQTLNQFRQGVSRLRDSL